MKQWFRRLLANRHQYGLFFLVVVAFLIRVYFSHQYAFWVDESNVVVESYRSFKELVFLEYWDKSHPPLFNVFVKYWKELGSGAFMLRLPSLGFSSLSLLLLFRVSKLLSRSTAVAFITVILAIPSGFLASLSIFSRPYGMQQFFALGFIYFWLLQAVAVGESRRELVMVFLFSLAATFTDYSFLWVLVVVSTVSVVSVGFRSLQKGKLDTAFLSKELKFGAISVLPFAIWLPVFVRVFNSALALEHYLGDNYPGSFLQTLGYVFHLFFLFSKDFLFNVFVVLVVSGFFLVKQFRKRKFPDAFIFLSHLAFIPLVTSVVVSYYFFPVALTKNLFVVYYAFLIFQALVVKAVLSTNRSLGIAVLLLLVGYHLSQTQPVIRANINYGYADALVTIRENLEQNRYFGASTVAIDELTYSSDYASLFTYYFGYYDGPPNLIPGKSVGDLHLIYDLSSVPNDEYVLIGERDLLMVHADVPYFSDATCEQVTHYGELVAYLC